MKRTLKKMWAWMIIRIMIVIMAFYATSAFGISLAWDPSPDTYVYVVGYAILYGTNSGSYQTYVDAGSQTNVTIQLPPGDGTTYYFVAIAYTVDRLESLPSNEVSYRPPLTGTGLDDSYTASPPLVINHGSGIISGNITTLPAEAKTVYWAKSGLNVVPGQILTLGGRMYYNGGGVVSVYLVDQATGVWLSPERTINVNNSYGYCQTDLIVRESSSNATLHVSCGLMPGVYEFQRTGIALTTPAVTPVTSLYLRQLLPRQIVGNLYSAEWLWSPVVGSEGYVVRTALTRDGIETGVLFSQQMLAASQTTYRCDINATLYNGVYIAVSSVVGGQESVPWITWYLPGDIFNTADEVTPPLCFQGGVDADDVNYAYTGYASSRRTPAPALTPEWPAGREERTDIDNNAYAGRVSDYSFIRSQYLNGRRMQ